MDEKSPSFEFQMEHDGTLSLEAAVFQALGYASMCWSETPGGIFESDKAKDVGEKLVEFIKMGDNSGVPVQAENRAVVEKLLSTTDAMVWAKEFCEIFVVYKRGKRPPESFDNVGLMVGWFANAIETAKAARQ